MEEYPQIDHHGEEFLKWVTTPSVGCHFARTLAANVEAAKWDGATILGNSIDAETVDVLNAYFAEACGKFEAVHALFPDIKTPAEVVSMIQAFLCHAKLEMCRDQSGLPARKPEAPGGTPLVFAG